MPVNMASTSDDVSVDTTFLVVGAGPAGASLACFLASYGLGGIMISAALTSFLTGITEPIEFAFIFVAPLLYVIHAILAGLAYFLCVALGINAK